MSRTPAPRKPSPPAKPDRFITALVVLIVATAIALAVLVLLVS